MSNVRRAIEINQHVAGPAPARLRTVRPRRLADYPGLPAVYRDLAARLSSPLRMGPPICDELIALVRHVFSEEEAGVARHLGLVSGRSARQLARAERRPLDQIEPILQRLAEEKRVIAQSGPQGDFRYRLPPIMPGMFEMVLVGHTPQTLSAWHRRFIELFEALYETGYALDYQQRRPTPAVRYLPVGKAIDAHPMALPSDKLEVVLDRFDAFGVGQCQCRMAMESLGRGCGKPLGNCLVMGQWAARGVEAGWLRGVSRREALEIKREAESHGLITWMMNVDSPHGQCSCSCCGCCCHALRMVNEFNAPGIIAPPHFVPRLDASRCTYCGRCAASCPMGAIVVDMNEIKDAGPTGQQPPAPRYRHLRERCIGCGLCALACDRRAISMEPVADYQLPYRSWFSLIAHAAPGSLTTAWKVWRQR